MPQLPTGTLTFLFSDIEGSTRFVQDLGERWNDVVEHHHRLMRAVVAEHAGTEVGTEGDSFFVAFLTAPAAVAGAVAAQRALATHRWPSGVQLRVRMGLHTGTASVAGGSYTGLDVHRAARITAAGHGGQVLLSDVTCGLAVAALPAKVELRDLGQHRLKDLSAPERLHQLVIDGLPADFPALRTLDAIRNNLPIQLTSFLGRERELADITALLDRARLITLTGPGGTGKTRLVLQAAAQLADRHPDGVWFVPLAAIRDPELVAPTVAQVLELPERGDRTPVERMLDHLRTRRALLVLDNFEQVVVAAPMMTELLAGAPELAALVTSRTVLHLYGEHEYVVPPLALPDLAHLPDAGPLSQYEAVALFIERASAAKPGFFVTNETARAVAEICVRLDGLPLAIELAAARIKLLTPRAILERLGRRLELLAGRARDVPERQRTLRGAIEWSYDLLEEPDRRLFACLSVFVGGGALEAVEAVGSAVEGIDALTAIGSLVDHSLVRQSEGVADEARFGMLETIREFALERSQASGRHAELQRRHAEWFAELAEGLASRIMGPHQRDALDRLELEHDNFRAAMSWAIEADRPDLALRLGSRLWRMWQMRLHITEGRERLRQALAMPRSGQYPALRADALEAAGGLAYWGGDVPATRDWYDQALEARRALGDPDAIAEALYNLSFAFSYMKPNVAPEDLATARGLAEEAMELFRERGNASGEARTLWMLASVDAVTGDFEAMEEKASQAEEVFRRLNDRFYLGWALWSSGFARIGMGRVEEARRPLRQALEIFEDADDVSGSLTMAEMAAIIAFKGGDYVRAARLSGAIAQAEAATGLDINLFPRAVLGFDPRPLRGADTAAAWEEGTRMEMKEAIAYAKEAL
jgi:predicted ATPase/class 3 adenylate cyclase